MRARDGSKSNVFSADVLELGASLVVAAARLERRLSQTTGAPDEVRRIVIGATRRAWSHRHEYPCDRAMDDWLVEIMHRAVLT